MQKKDENNNPETALNYSSDKFVKIDLNNPEKEENVDNIYFYLIHYTKENFLWIYSYIYENILFEYPLPLSIKQEQSVSYIYQKIFTYLNEYNNMKEDLNLDLSNEKKIGFVIYINNDKVKQNKKSICSEIYDYFNKYNNKIRFLEKFNFDSNYSEIKHKYNINKNKRFVLNIDVLNNIDKEKLPKIENKNNQLKFKTKINLNDCFDYFFSEEKIEENAYYCHKCKRRNKKKKKMDINKEPYYLIIQFNRFKINSTDKNSKFFNAFNYTKNDIFIDFPLQNFDLSEYIFGNENQRAKYNLIGVINHYGDGFYGHYTSYCLNRNNWYCFDDETVTEINRDKIVTNSAYILFYQKNI